MHCRLKIGRIFVVLKSIYDSVPLLAIFVTIEKCRADHLVMFGVEVNYGVEEVKEK